jgi:hypothetical protein
MRPHGTPPAMTIMAASADAIEDCRVSALHSRRRSSAVCAGGWSRSRLGSLIALADDLEQQVSGVLSHWKIAKARRPAQTAGRLKGELHRHLRSIVGQEYRASIGSVTQIDR